MRGTGNRPPFSYLPKHGGVPWGDAEPWQANLQELEPPTCGGEKRTFRKRLPKEAGATKQSETAGSGSPE